MLKNIFKPRTVISEIEVEIENLEKRRAEIVTRVGNAELALKQVREERREILSTTGDFDLITKRCSEIANQLADLRVVLDDVDAQGADAIARLAKARDQAERATSAESLEKVASAAEQRIPEIEKAAGVFAKAISGLRYDLGDVSLWESHNASRPEGSVDERKDRATAREVAAGIVAEVLARQMPWLFETFNGRDGYRSAMSRIMDPKSTQRNWTAEQPLAPLSTAEIVQSLVCTPLREQALAIKDGTADTEKPRQQHVADDYVRPLAPANVSVFVTRPFTYVGSEFGDLEVVPDGWVRNVPEPVATTAEARDLCVRASSPRGEAFLAAARERKGSSDIRVRPEDCVELGDVLRLRISPEERSSGHERRPH
ncbi:hypothetical protein Arad_3632 [Rhizobium rhizogenes K84]|uniref:Uncharacterized protein n=2 Tax=Rhizobium rhizogenes TaxID=359 RepID=B9J9D5_RHIR8|nr:hypothetical protein Arad_3632 [Rhizobium rhizogenes K84]